MQQGAEQNAPGQPGAHWAADDVLSYLKTHPDFLMENPAVLDSLAPPRRVHGPVLVDFMAAMLDQARVRAAQAERAGAQAASGRRAAEGFGRRVQDTVLALMRAPDPAWLATYELAGLLHLDGARVCSEAAVPPAGAARVPAGTVAATLGQRAAIVRPTRPHSDSILHGEAAALAAEEALVRVPLMTGSALLALASRDARGLAGAGTDALAFLGQAVGAALDRAVPPQQA